MEAATHGIVLPFCTRFHHSKPVQGTFIAMDAQEQRIRINALHTLVGTYDQVVLRGTDVDALEVTIQVGELK
jgi:hypothetical protein